MLSEGHIHGDSTSVVGLPDKLAIDHTPSIQAMLRPLK